MNKLMICIPKCAQRVSDSPSDQRPQPVKTSQLRPFLCKFKINTCCSVSHSFRAESLCRLTCVICMLGLVILKQGNFLLPLRKGSIPFRLSGCSSADTLRSSLCLAVTTITWTPAWLLQLWPDLSNAGASVLFSSDVNVIAVWLHVFMVTLMSLH